MKKGDKKDCGVGQLTAPQTLMLGFVWIYKYHVNVSFEYLVYFIFKFYFPIFFLLQCEQSLYKAVFRSSKHVEICAGEQSGHVAGKLPYF